MALAMVHDSEVLSDSIAVCKNETRFNSLEMELLVMDGWFMN